MAKLSIASFNSTGFGEEKIKLMVDLCKSHNFVLLQKYWLFHNQTDKFSAIPGTCFHAVSRMPSGILLIGRPYGGCAILSNLRHNVSTCVKVFPFNLSSFSWQPLGQLLLHHIKNWQ